MAPHLGPVVWVLGELLDETRLGRAGWNGEELLGGHQLVVPVDGGEVEAVVVDEEPTETRVVIEPLFDDIVGQARFLTMSASRNSGRPPPSNSRHRSDRSAKSLRYLLWAVAGGYPSMSARAASERQCSRTSSRSGAVFMPWMVRPALMRSATSRKMSALLARQPCPMAWTWRSSGLRW